MEDVRTSIITLLNKAIEHLLETAIPRSIIYRLLLCAEGVYQPCLVAVVGQVNSGKSTFINALLEEDLTQVGINETTATINYFRYGTIGSEGLIHCFWLDGKYDSVSQDFVRKLQENDVQTLQDISNIDHIEYYLSHPFLQDIILVDTPGLGSIKSEHQQQTVDFLQDKKQSSRQPDAIIYLVSATTREEDQTILDTFQQATQGQTHTYNSLVVMTKIDDLDPDLIDAHEIPNNYLTSQLKSMVNTVVPVSAALQRLLDRFVKQDNKELQSLIEEMGQLPPHIVAKMLAEPELFLEYTPSREKWERWLKDSPWMAFRIIAQKADEAARLNLDVDTVIEQLYSIAGFDELRTRLKKLFLERSHILHIFHILNYIRSLLDEVKYRVLQDLLAQKNTEKALKERFFTFLNQLHEEQETTNELKTFLQTLPEYSVKDIEDILTSLYADIDKIEDRLRPYNTNFESLQLLSPDRDKFTEEELNELDHVFGAYGLKIEDRLPQIFLTNENRKEHINQRQRFWHTVEHDGRERIRRDIAGRAANCYGQMLPEMQGRDIKI